MELLVCVGSACHMRGAHAVLEECKELIRELGLRTNPAQSRFCQGRCTEGLILSLWASPSAGPSKSDGV